MPRLWGPPAVWAALIFLSSSPMSAGGPPGVSDWITHGAAYAVLSLLVCRALAGGFPLPLSWRGGVLAVLLATAYGVSDEWHQSFVPHRHSSAGDVAKDFCGAALGVFLYRRATDSRRLPAR